MIQAEVIADSKDSRGNRITTMVVTFPRIVLAEFNTHRMFSRNSASSRAIPFKKMVKMVEENPFIPLAFQKDHKGMQGIEYVTDPEHYNYCVDTWLEARDAAVKHATELNTGLSDKGVTKQLCNRLLEPFMYHKVIVTSTEFENFFKLRCPQYSMVNDSGVEELYRSKKEYLENLSTHDYNQSFNWTLVDWFKINKSQAEIHIQAAAESMWDAMNESTPKKLKGGEWHIPFGDNIDKGELIEASIDMKDMDKHIFVSQQMVKVAVARCARISYQTLGDNPKIDYERDLGLYEMLASSGHWSPFEHVAQCMYDDEYIQYTNGQFTNAVGIKIKSDFPTEIYLDMGVNFREENGFLDVPMLGWCRNFRGFIQQRALIDG